MEWYTIALIAAFFSATAAILEKKILFRDKSLKRRVIATAIMILGAILIITS